MYRTSALLAVLALTLALSGCGTSEAVAGEAAEGALPTTPAAGGPTEDVTTTTPGAAEPVTVRGLPLLTVEDIEPGVDGYTAHLTDSIGGDYVAVISIPNLEDAFVSLDVGDTVTIAGDYAESHPVRIFDVTEINVTTPPGRPTTSSTAPSGEEPLVIHLAGYTTIYSQDGEVQVSGWLDRPGRVSIGGTPAEVIDDQYDGISTFEAVLDLQPGSHAITITATDSAGLESYIVLTVLVDPNLDVRLVLIEDVDPAARTLTADPIEFLLGDEATAAARMDGVIGVGEEVPGGFYLRSLGTERLTLTLGDYAMVALQACFAENGPCVVEQAVRVDEWVELIADPGLAGQRHDWAWYGNSGSPYWVTIQDGTVVQLREQYLP